MCDFRECREGMAMLAMQELLRGFCNGPHKEAFRNLKKNIMEIAEVF
jgi:hypothetical protein